MKKSSVLIIVIFVISGYQVTKFLKNKEASELHKPIEVNTSEEKKKKGTKSFVKNDEDKNQFIMKDKRINPIAPNPRPTPAVRIERPSESSVNPSIRNNPIRNKIPQNLERILQYELNTWSRGLDSEEIGYLKHLWGLYTSMGTFGSEEEKMVEKLEKRNILNAIRASKPTIIKSKDDIEKEESKHREREFADLDKSYDEDPAYNNSYNDNYENYSETQEQPYVEPAPRETAYDRVERDVNRPNRGNPIRDDYEEDFYEEEHRARTLEMPIDSYDNYENQSGFNEKGYDVDGGDEVIDRPDDYIEEHGTRDYYDDSY